MYCKICGKKLSIFDEDDMCGACSKEEKEKHAAEKHEALQAEKKRIVSLAKKIEIITTASERPCEVICPLSHTLSNYQLKNVFKKYDEDAVLGELMKAYCISSESNIIALTDVAFGHLRTEMEACCDTMYYLCLAELRMKAAKLGCDAITGMRVNTAYDRITGDTSISSQLIAYMQMYGTGVKYKN